jgi:hypothetical protein
MKLISAEEVLAVEQAELAFHLELDYPVCPLIPYRK